MRVKLNERGEVINFNAYMAHAIRKSEIDMDKDNDGQIIFYSGFYKWSDGSIHEEPELHE